jgi:alpha-glucoside transport system substrate-binding protein
MRPRFTRVVVALAAAACLCATATACGVGGGGVGQEPTVTIIVPWTGAELNAFTFVVDQFASAHHFRPDIESTPAFAQQLDADAATGDLPDLVDLPSPGAVEQYERKADGLKPLSVSLSSYDQPWRGLAESSSGTVYAVPVKADVKSLIWYKSGVLPGPTWAALQNVSRRGTPWCLGLASGSASGWPGADWVADILLSGYGAGAYQSWLTGTWEGGRVGAAWRTWGSLMRDGAAVPGGVLAVLETSYNSAIAAQGCDLEHGALSASGLTSTAGYSYEPFPSISGGPAPVLVSGDFMGLFTSNPYARSLLAYLASYPAQKSWVNQPGAHAFSADGDVQPGDYPAGAERGIASLLKPATGRTLCFSAEDIMAPDLSTAFEQAILDYVSKPGSLPGLLSGLQKTADGVQGDGELQVAKKACDLREGNQMADVVEFTLDDGTAVAVSAGPRSGSGAVGLGDHVQAAEKTLRQALAPVTAAATQVIEGFRATAGRPEEIEISFGVTLDGRLGGIIAAAQAGAHLDVTLRWHNHAPSDG